MFVLDVRHLPLACVLIAFAAHATEPVPVEAFARFSKLGDQCLSPEGQHLVPTSDFGYGNFGVIVYRLSDMEHDCTAQDGAVRIACTG